MLVNRVKWLLALGLVLAACERNASTQPSQEPISPDQAMAEIKTAAASPEPVKHRFGEVGVAEILVPGGKPPVEGWPVVLALHGDGGARQNLRDFLPLLADLGMASLAISAPIRDMGGDGYLWPPHTGYKLLMQYLSSAIEPFRESNELNFKKVYLLGMQQGGWYAMLLLAVSPELFSGAIALGPVPKSQELPNAPAPASRPLAIVVSASDVKGAFVAAHFENLWRQGGSPFTKDVIPNEENTKERWLLSVFDHATWLNQQATFDQGRLIEKLDEYPAVVPP